MVSKLCSDLYLECDPWQNMVYGNAYQCILYSYSNIHKEFISNLDGILHNDFHL